MWLTLKVLLFDVQLPIIDRLLDLFIIFRYVIHGQHLWWILTTVVIFVPSILEILYLFGFNGTDHCFCKRNNVLLPYCEPRSDKVKGCHGCFCWSLISLTFPFAIIKWYVKLPIFVMKCKLDNSIIMKYR